MHHHVYGPFGPRNFLLGAALLAALTSPALAQSFVFGEVDPVQVGLEPHFPPGNRALATGAAAADIDGDGDVDLFMPQAAASQLYENLGDGTFDNVAGTALPGDVACRAALWIDVDNDGDLDLLTAHDKVDFRLFRNDSAGGALSFTDITAGTGDLGAFPTPSTSHDVGGLSAGDIDNDGDLDLYASFWQGGAYLFLNLGPDGAGNVEFDDITAMSQIVSGMTPWQSMMFDANADGWIDIFQTIDLSSNQLWINQGDNMFVDRADLAGVDIGGTDMGVAMSDYDDDGDLDLYVTQISEPGCFNPSGPNSLFRNDSTGVPGAVASFSQVSLELGVDHAYWGWGATWIDADRDGDLDLAVTNGEDELCPDKPTRFFLNPGDGTAFLERAAEVDFLNHDWGSALLAFDFDRDGDLDLLHVGFGIDPLRLYENLDASGHSHLVVRPRAPSLNRFAIGAVVRVAAGGRQMSRLISAGTSVMGQEPAEAFFGLGTAAVADLVTVEWPDGNVTHTCNVAADQVMDISPTTDGCPDNGLFCDGEEICDPVAGCTSTGNPCPPKKICSEVLDICFSSGPS